jgi:hypothetical protein
MTLALQKNKYAPKRNKFQIANDRKLAIELLSAGKTYTQIAAHIGAIREYTLSHQQVRQDVGTVQEELIASTLQHGLESIAEELDKIENVMVDVSRRLSNMPDNDRGAAPLLKLMADLMARKTYLTGGETWVKAQNLSEAIERVTRAGFVVCDPQNISMSEAINVQPNLENA